MVWGDRTSRPGPQFIRRSIMEIFPQRTVPSVTAGITGTALHHILVCLGFYFLKSEESWIQDPDGEIRGIPDCDVLSKFLQRFPRFLFSLPGVTTCYYRCTFHVMSFDLAIALLEARVVL